MTHSTSYNQQTGIIETTLHGAIGLQEIGQLIAEATEIASHNQCYLWLTDYSDAEPDLSTTEIYQLPKLFAHAAEVLEIPAVRIRRAIVVSHTGADYPFARTIAANRGQSLELFEDLETARAWLRRTG